MTTSIANNELDHDIPIWNVWHHINHELTVKQMVVKILTGTAEYDYNLIAVTELLDCGFWINEEVQFDLPYTLSHAATRIYMAIEHGVFCYHAKDYVGLTREEYEQGLTEIVASGTVAFRLTSPIYGDMSMELLDRAWNCMGDMSRIITKYMQDDGRDYSSKEVATAVFNSMTEHDRERYIELDRQRIKYCTDAEQMLIRQSEESTGNMAPTQEKHPDSGMRPLGPFATGFIPNVKIIDGITHNATLGSYSHGNNCVSPIPSNLPNTNTVNDRYVNISERSGELFTTDTERSGVDVHKLDRYIVNLEPTRERSQTGITALSTPHYSRT